MPGFTYTPIDNIFLNSYRNMLAVDCDNAIVGDFTIPTSTGNFSVSFGGGASWTPTLILIMGIKQGDWVGNTSDAILHIGAATEDAQWAVGVWRDNGSGNAASVFRTDKVISSVDALAVDFEAAWVSMDSGGFTLNVTNAPASAWICAYLAVDCSAAVGSTLGPSSAGDQSITGQSFAPDAMFVCSVLHTATGLITTGTGLSLPNLCLGAADTDDEQYAAYGGHHSTGNWAFNRYDNAHCLLQAETAAGAAPLRQQASVSAWNGDGVTLDFDTATAAYYYNWILLTGGGNTRFQYPTDTAGAGQTHDTKVAPRAIIGYGNSMATENTSIEGCGMGLSLSACSELSDIERCGSIMIVSRGDPGGAGRPAQRDGSASSFGSFIHRAGGVADSFMENQCLITACDLGIPTVMPHMWRYRYATT